MYLRVDIEELYSVRLPPTSAAPQSLTDVTSPRVKGRGPRGAHKMHGRTYAEGQCRVQVR